MHPVPEDAAGQGGGGRQDPAALGQPHSSPKAPGVQSLITTPFPRNAQKMVAVPADFPFWSKPLGDLSLNIAFWTDHAPP